MDLAPSRRFALLDRDGTIIEGVQPYVLHPDHVALLPGAVEGLRHLHSLGLGLIVVTNQSAVGRGLMDAVRLEEINRRFGELLSAEGVPVDGIYACTHHPDHECECRKPKPGLVEQAAREFEFDPRASFVIGDNVGDIGLGQAVGATTLLVRTGYGREVEAKRLASPDYVADDLASAAGIIETMLSLSPSAAR